MKSKMPKKEAITPVPVALIFQIHLIPLLISTVPLLQLFHIVNVAESYCGALQILFPYQE